MEPSANSPDHRECDLLLFVATKTELEQLRLAARHRDIAFDELHGRDADPRESYWLGELGGHRTIAVKTSVGALAHGGSAASGFHFMSRTHATRVLCLGMAFGVSRKQQCIGDVLVADSVFPYEKRDVVRTATGWEYSYDERATTYPSSRELLRILETQRGRASSLGFRVERGCLLTGHARIQCEAYRADVTRWSSRVATGIVGGEMEGVGLLSLSPRGRPNWMIVKGICDFADHAQEQDARANRQVACRNAADFVLDALSAWTPGSS